MKIAKELPIASSHPSHHNLFLSQPKTTSSSIDSTHPVKQKTHQKCHPLQQKFIQKIKEDKKHTAQSSTLPSLDLSRVASNAFLSGLSIGPTFGTITALNNYLHSQLHICPAIRIAAGFGPMIAGIASSLLGDKIRLHFDITSTNADKASLKRDATTPASFITISSIYGYCVYSKLFTPKSPTIASLMTITIATLGSSIGGGLTEVVGQGIPSSAPKILTEDFDNPTALQVGVGRSTTLIPTVVFNHVNAAYIASTGAMHSALAKQPKVAAVTYPLIVGLPFIFRKSVTPSSPNNHPNTTS